MPRIMFSIKIRFVLTAALIVALSTAAWGWWVWQNEQRLLYTSQRDQGELLMTSLATPIINALLYEEMGIIEEGGLLDNFVEEIMNNRKFPTNYAFVTDQSGKVLAHNRYTEHGKIYSDPMTHSALAGITFSSRLIDVNDGTPLNECSPLERPSFLCMLSGIGGRSGAVLDMAVPLKIHGKSWGTLRVGVLTAPLEQQLNALAKRIVSFGGAFFLACTTLFYIVGLRLARPLLQLSGIMSRISPERLEANLPSSRHDEIGLLQESFRGMLHRLRKSEEERQRAEDELIRSDRLATIGKIVAGVAHEVNNPLAALSACVYNLESRLPGDLRKYADILKNGTQRIETIVRQLTDFSRSGELFLQPVHSDQFFKEVSAFGSMALKKHRISFIATDTAPLTVLFIDKGKMHQVALNLLLNAAEASPPGGTVELLAHREGTWYCLSVKDQGMGIPEEARGHIFEIFYTTKPPGKGTGIGLAICKTIVEMHHGEIVFASEPGQTTFVTRVPIVKEETGEEP